MDTIFALASAPGKAGVAVIRVSGPDAFDGARQLAGERISGRGMWLRPLRGADGELIDQALVLGFSSPASFTGEDVVEYQLHGSVAIIGAMMHTLSEFPGHRLAEPGEFTRRAMENGKMDLSQVEGLADLIEAETEAQRRQATRLTAGELGQRVERWRVDLIRAAALIEATIDFADEDVPVDVTPEVSELLNGVERDVAKELRGLHAAERIRTGFEVAIIGPPNAGKSTLLNALAGRTAALTSEFAGTTRDVIEVRMDLDGLPVTVLDTAGLRDTDDHVESLGIALAKERAGRSDLRVFLSGDAAIDFDLWQDGDIRVSGKADLLSETQGLAVSGLTGEGVDELVSLISQELGHRVASAGLATRERHKVALDQALDRLRQARELLKRGPEEYDLVAEELRTAIRSLEFLVGRIDVENLLDEIFASFCLGK